MIVFLLIAVNLSLQSFESQLAHLTIEKAWLLDTPTPSHSVPICTLFKSIYGVFIIFAFLGPKLCVFESNLGSCCRIFAYSITALAVGAKDPSILRRSSFAPWAPSFA